MGINVPDSMIYPLYSTKKIHLNAACFIKEFSESVTNSCVILISGDFNIYIEIISLMHISNNWVTFSDLPISDCMCMKAQTGTIISKILSPSVIMIICITH